MSKKFDSGKIDFVGKTKFFVIVSTVLVLGSLALIGFGRLNMGIDFTGGTEIQVKFAQPLGNDKKLQEIVTQTLNGAVVQSFDGSSEFVIRFQNADGVPEEELGKIQQERVVAIKSAITTSFAAEGPEFRRVDSVGPQVGDQMKRNAVLALFYALVVILIYVGLRFDYEYAPGAVLCLFHDAIITVGVFALIGREINVQMVAAVLTIIGYSINDTIVVYDRIREVAAESDRDVPLMKIINKATNDMLSRTIILSFTTFISCFALYMIAGGTISDFALAMLVGIVVGVYSSIYVAAPSIVLFREVWGAKKAA